MFKIHMMLGVVKHVTTSIAPGAMAQTMMCMGGNMVVIGVHTQWHDGYSYKSKETALQNIAAPELQKALVEKQAFAFNMRPGDMCRIPPCFSLCNTALSNPW